MQEHWNIEQFKQYQNKGTSKYKAKKTQIDGHTFDSEKEANRYIELKILENTGEIAGLELQKRFILQPKFNFNGKNYKEISYIADFTYWDCATQELVIEDVKSIATKKDKVYAIKKKMLLKKLSKSKYCYRFREEI